ncbi:MAG: hypothetical protein HKN09_10075 [Saprospiraceae bacterium]|nr:hypothetical protein [Saprospiraceae bacterium]
MEHTQKWVLLLVILFIVSALSAQWTDVSWGPVYKKDSGLFSGYRFIDIDDDGYYVLHEDNNGQTIVHYDLNHRIVSVNALMLRSPFQPLLIQDIVRTKAGIFLILHYLDDRSKEWIMMASPFIEGEFRDPFQIYAQRHKLKPVDLRRAYEQFENAQADGMLVSEDSTKVAFLHILPGQDYKKDEYITVAVFDENLKLEWQSTHFYKFSKKEFEITQSEVSSDGKVFMVGWTHKKRSGSKRGSRSEEYLPDFEYKLYEIREGEIIQDIVNIGDRVAPLDVALFFPDPKKSDFLLTGFYTDDNHKTRQKGLFFAKGHPDVGLLSSQITEFKARDLKNLVSDRAISKGKGLDLSYDINQLLRFDNGTLGFVAEKNYVSYTNNNDYYNPYYGYYNSFYGPNYREPLFHTDDILIPVFDTEGNIMTIHKVEKDFTSSHRSRTSYAFAQANGSTFLIFNDRKSKDERKSANRRGSRFTDILRIGPSGLIADRSTLFTNVELDLDFVTSNFANNDDTIIISSESNRRFAFGLMLLN